MRIEFDTTYYPRLTAWHVRRALKWISKSDIEGLALVRLMDEEPDDPESHKKPGYLRGFLYNGSYFKSGKDKPAHINLYTRDLSLTCE